MSTEISAAFERRELCERTACYDLFFRRHANHPFSKMHVHRPCGRIVFFRAP